MNINNLTIKEIKKICNSQEDCLPTCPFYIEEEADVFYNGLECLFTAEPPCYWREWIEEDCD